MTISRPKDQEATPSHRAAPPTLAEQLRTMNPPPLGDGSYYVQDGIFSSDEEMEAFIAFVHESRRTGIA